MPAISTIRPTKVFVLEDSAAAVLGCGGTFYSTLWRRYLLLDIPKKYSNQTISKVTANVIGAHYFDSQFHVQDALSGFTR